jgi:hypothetical protein
MATQDPEDRSGEKEAVGKGSRPIRLKSAGKGTVLYKKAFGETSEEKRIHARRPLPPVPEAPPDDTEKNRK